MQARTAPTAHSTGSAPPSATPSPASGLATRCVASAGELLMSRCTLLPGTLPGQRLRCAGAGAAARVAGVGPDHRAGRLRWHGCVRAATGRAQPAGRRALRSRVLALLKVSRAALTRRPPVRRRVQRARSGPVQGAGSAPASRGEHAALAARGPRDPQVRPGTCRAGPSRFLG